MLAPGFMNSVYCVCGSSSEEMSVGRKEAFEIFRRDYAHNETIEENKKTLKQR